MSCQLFPPNAITLCDYANIFYEHFPSDFKNMSEVKALCIGLTKYVKLVKPENWLELCCAEPRLTIDGAPVPITEIFNWQRICHPSMAQYFKAVPSSSRHTLAIKMALRMANFSELDQSHKFFKISTLICHLLTKLNQARATPDPVPIILFRHGKNVKLFPEFSSISNNFPIVLPFASLELSVEDFPNAIMYPNNHVFWNDLPEQSTSSTLKRAAERLELYNKAKDSEKKAFNDFESKKAKLLKAQAELPILISRVEDARAAWEGKRQTTKDIEQAFQDGEVIAATFEKVQPDISRSKFCISIINKFLDIDKVNSDSSSDSSGSESSKESTENEEELVE